MSKDKSYTSVACFTALDLYCGKGRVKKWALENVILKCLYDTELEHARYIKLEDISHIKGSDKDTEEELIIPFGYGFRIPRTEIDLHIVKKNGKLYIRRADDFGYGWDEVENTIIDFLFNEKKKGNLYYQTSLNGEKYKI